MYLARLLLALIALVSLARALPAAETRRRPISRRPVVLWHGLGDSAFSPVMAKLKEAIEAMHPGIYVHNVALKPTFLSDQHASIYGNVNDQVDQVCAQLERIPQLARGFDAVGFSQGGQFMRAYVQRCNAPRVHNLMTFGSQHMVRACANAL